MTVKLSTGARTGMLQATGFAELFAKGRLELRSGPQPASADAADAGTLLALVTDNAGAFTPGTATNGLDWEAAAAGAIAKALAQTWKGLGVAAGTIGHFRLKGNAADTGSASTSLPRVDGSIGTSGADVTLGNLTVVTSPATPITIDSFGVTLPGF